LPRHLEVNIHEAKTHLSRLLSKVSQGEEVVIARAGRPIARLLPISNTGTKRLPARKEARSRLQPTLMRRSIRRRSSPSDEGALRYACCITSWGHGDPFDRVLIGQSLIEDLPIITADRAFRSYDVRLIWAGRRAAR
jgi:prevent-host-death family protein